MSLVSFDVPDRRHASMGPRPIGRGDAGLRFPPANNMELQWGRVRSDAEIQVATHDMWPACQLQWGRVRSDAEIAIPSDASPVSKWLQWGRVRSDAEMAISRSISR